MSDINDFKNRLSSGAREVAELINTHKDELEEEGMELFTVVINTDYDTKDYMVEYVVRVKS